MMKISSLFNKLIHKHKWNILAKKNANYYIWSHDESMDEEKYRESGLEDFRTLVLSDELIKSQGNLKEKIFLEIGCGNGRMTEFIAKIFKKVISVDISAEMIRLANVRLKDVSNVDFIETDGFSYAAKTREC